MESKHLYQEVILDHNKKPRNWGKVADASHQAEGLNPLCGDHIWLSLKLEGDKVGNIAFEGESCAICKASSSMMTTNDPSSSRNRSKLRSSATRAHHCGMSADATAGCAGMPHT